MRSLHIDRTSQGMIRNSCDTPAWESRTVASLLNELYKPIEATYREPRTRSGMALWTP
jgi:hypothetical protein